MGLGQGTDWGRERTVGLGQGTDWGRERTGEWGHTSPTSGPLTPYHEGRRVRGPLVEKVCT